jgi:hypothetical protein
MERKKRRWKGLTQRKLRNAEGAENGRWRED